jgi:hypothetical protein
LGQKNPGGLKMSNQISFTRDAVSLYVERKYNKLNDQGLLGCVRVLLAHTIFTEVWEKEKNWQLVVEPGLEIFELPHLTEHEKVMLYHMVAQQSFYPDKHHGKIFAHEGKVYIKPWYELVDRKSGDWLQATKLYQIQASVVLVHEMDIYRPPFKTLAQRVRVLSVLYRDPSKLTADELALLADPMITPDKNREHLLQVTSVPSYSL